ncbi:PTS transporter subunit EIIC [Proteiniclasticum sp. SCR006]|uniref:PTS transporter subunit EIIC n=1 Tax=Proteiniclasticum aestuarii TaxID=2817862 RepID=A0A939H9H8_9CLOT|nr:fructose-specific PTS transporter subunit EIIC [Proteiniclasticum aestuarii]MBO1264438.1 PTS transporter subunit EIIC [Proteiniclasticum aestuarii]
MKIIAVTSCPTGIAHTYMAAEALQIAAKEMGHEMKVETQGSVGAENVITEADLQSADAVILAIDTNIDKSRFQGIPVVEASVKDAIKDAKGLITKALAAKPVSARVDYAEEMNGNGGKSKSGIYKHLMTGVSFMIPFVVAGGLLIAFSFAFGIHAADEEGTLAAALMTIGGSAFGLMVPILAGYIAYSIADRPGIVPGMVGGIIANSLGTGFLGGLIAGFLAGYVILAIRKVIKLPKSFEGLMPVLILPVISTLVVGLILIFVLGGPVKSINDAMLAWLDGMSGANAVVLGGILGIMMAADMGGPINKAAYTFGAATIAQGEPSGVMAAVMAAGMVPPLAIALSTVLAKNKYTLEEREAGKANWALGASFITEGAIPFAAADPLRVIPSMMVGSAVAGALSMLFGATLAVPHGGIFVLPIPNAVGNLPMYILAIVVGSAVGGLMLTALKKKKA